MAKVPKPRKPGQTGGGGRHGQSGNRERSGSRGGNPYRGGGGQGKKPAGKSSSSVTGPIKGLVYTIAGAVGLVIASITVFFLNGYGVI